MIRLLLLAFALVSPVASLACTTDDATGEGSPCWVIEVPDHGAWQTAPAASAVEAILKSLGNHSGRRIQIAGYPLSGAGLSLALARVQVQINELRKALLQRAGKLRIAIDSSMVVAPSSDTGRVGAGQVIVRIL